MLINIEIPDDVNQVFSVILDNVVYDIKLMWNVRDEAWYMFFGTQGNTPRFHSKITVGADILRPYVAYDDIPKGILTIVDNEKRYGRISRDAWSSGRFKLVYLTPDELG